MNYKSYFRRIILASIIAILITLFLGIFVMWLNGFIENDDNVDNGEVLSVCKFNDNPPNEFYNPFIRKNIKIDCVNEKNTKPLILDWFERLFNNDFDKNYIRKNAE